MINQRQFVNWRVSTLAQIKAIANANVKTLCFCDATETLYRYDPTSGATADDQFVLTTGAGGTTRWIGTGGKYNLPVSGGLGIVLGFGASMGGGDTGKYFQPHGDANGGKFNTLTSESQLACPIAGTIQSLSWISEQVPTQAVLKIWKNGAVVVTLGPPTYIISASSGALTGFNISITAGNLLAVEYDAVGTGNDLKKTAIELFVRGV
jgi:hypothetical protein